MAHAGNRLPPKEELRYTPTARLSDATTIGRLRKKTTLNNLGQRLAGRFRDGGLTKSGSVGFGYYQTGGLRSCSRFHCEPFKAADPRASLLPR